VEAVAANELGRRSRGGGANSSHGHRWFTRDLVDELRAGRDAMFRMLDRLDRLDGGDAPASA